MTISSDHACHPSYRLLSKLAPGPASVIPVSCYVAGTAAHEVDEGAHRRG